MNIINLIFRLSYIGFVVSYTSYSGYQVLKTIPLKLNESALLKLYELYQRPEFDFWSKPRVGHSVEVMAAPQHLETLKKELIHLGLKHSVLIPDVGAVVETERAEIERLRNKEGILISGRAPILNKYLTFEEIQAYLVEVETLFPNIASIINIGTSYEGRPVTVLKLSNGPGKTGIFFDALIHAREWIGPPLLLYAINELTENLATNQAMLDANDFYFLPITNPDGYAYTWDTTRLWRKNRSINNGSDCIGTDLNRNFDQHWGEGGIPHPCDDTYPGSAPESEAEVKALADFIISNPNITFYCSVHSHSQYILYPWGHTTLPPPNVDYLDRIANAAYDALHAVNGTTYQIGSSANLLYFAYGTSHDWAYEGADIPLSYTLELPDGGIFGFNPPPSFIGPVNTETWEAIKVFAANIPQSRIPLP